MERLRSRRYPLYWDSRSSRGEAATRLLAQHSGVITPAASADDLFTGLVARVDALDRLAEPPLTTALAVARLKRYLLDPVRRIDLDNLVSGVVTTAASKAAAYPTHLGNLDGQALDDRYAAMLSDVTPVLDLVIEGVRHDQDRDHTGLWIRSVHRLMLARTLILGAHQAALDTARHYPALLTLRAAGITSLVADRNDVLFRLLTEPTWRDPMTRKQMPAVLALRDYTVASADVVNTFPRWVGHGLTPGQTWLYAPSHLLRTDLREILRPLPDDEDYQWAHDRYEYRVGLVQYHLEPRPVGWARSTPGEFILARHWTEEQPVTETDFRAVAGQAGEDWPWWRVVGGEDGLESVLTGLRAELAEMRRFG